MTVLPVLQRELRLSAQRRLTYAERMLAGLFSLCICLPLIFSTWTVGNLSENCEFVFIGITTVGFLLSVAASPLAAIAIGSEKHEGTLGLLLLTRVSIYDV